MNYLYLTWICIGNENQELIFKNEIEAQQIINSIHAIAQILRNIKVIDLAASKTQKTVFALKNYSYQPHDGAKILTNLKENIETVLTIYQGQLKNGIEVIFNNEEIPDIYVFPEARRGVW